MMNSWNGPGIEPLDSVHYAHILFIMQAIMYSCKYMRSNGSAHRWRSEWPLNTSTTMPGDLWPFLILLDMMLRGFQSYKEVLDSCEAIAANILADSRARQVPRKLFLIF